MRKYSPTFRQEETQRIATRWDKSQSVSVIGVGSIGKSNFLQHLTSQTTLDRYFGERAQRILPILIDANLLGSLRDDEQFRCWAGYELIMHRLYLAAYPFESLDTDANLFFQTYQRLQDGTNPLYAYTGLRYLELGFEFFFRRGYQIILMFDEFELFLKTMPVRFFLNLRGLRDTHKQQLTYTTFSREPLPRLTSRYNIGELDIEPFLELFTDHELYIGPYNAVDALTMAGSLLAGTQSDSQFVYDYLVKISGGFAGIMRAAAQLLNSTDLKALDNALLARIVAASSIRTECDTILKALDEDERHILDIAIGRKPANDISQAAVDLLVRKSLLSQNEAGVITVEPPILRAYLLEKR